MVHQSGSADGTHRLCEGALCAAKGPPQGHSHRKAVFARQFADSGLDLCCLRLQRAPVL
jgi:hypothetical protein